jgi:hypothetical protein
VFFTFFCGNEVQLISGPIFPPTSDLRPSTSDLRPYNPSSASLCDLSALAVQILFSDPRSFLLASQQTDRFSNRVLLAADLELITSLVTMDPEPP